MLCRWRKRGRGLKKRSAVGGADRTRLGCGPMHRVLLVIPFHLCIQLLMLLLHGVRPAKKTFRRHREKLGGIGGPVITQDGALAALDLCPTLFISRLHSPRPGGIARLAHQPRFAATEQRDAVSLAILEIEQMSELVPD